MAKAGFEAGMTVTRLLTASLAFALVNCASVPPTKPTGTIKKAVHYAVKKNCGERRNCFVSLQSALVAAEADKSDRWIIVDIDPGDYYEKVTVVRGKIRLQGHGEKTTRLYFDAVAQTAGHYHRKNWGTPGSATLTINADQVSVDGMTIENTFDYLANDALPDNDPGKMGNSQAVSVLLDINSDRVTFTKSALTGYQDTLFANGRRVLIRDSLISGNVDFIFGNGQVLIEDSTIQSRRRASPASAENFESFITAPSTQLSQAMGIVVYRSRLTREPGIRDGAVALGRPWHPTTSFPDGRYADPDAVGQATFIDCFMDAHIHPNHWASMNGTARDGTKSAVFAPQDSRFSESGSYGPGARHSDIRIKWNAPIDITTVRKVFFEGWIDPN